MYNQENPAFLNMVQKLQLIVKQLLTNCLFIYYKFNIVYHKSFIALRPLPFHYI